MKRAIQFLIFFQLLFQITACQSVKSNKVDAPEKTKTESNQNPPPAEKSTAPKNEKSAVKTGCLPANVPRSEGLPETADMYNTLETDNSVGGLNKTLKNLFDELSVAENVKGDNFFEADFNGDGCKDAAIIVKAVDEYPIDGEINNALRFQMAETIVQNLEKGGLMNLQRTKKEGFKPTEKDLTDSKIALAVIFGGEKSWNWEYGGEGRLFLLLDSVFSQNDCPDCQTVLVNKTDKKSSRADCLPSVAVGDALFSGGEEAGRAIYFDGKKFDQKQCGD